MNCCLKVSFTGRLFSKAFEGAIYGAGLGAIAGASGTLGGFISAKATMDSNKLTLTYWLWDGHILKDEHIKPIAIYSVALGAALGALLNVLSFLVTSAVESLFALPEEKPPEPTSWFTPFGSR